MAAQKTEGDGVTVDGTGRILVSGERIKAILAISQGTLQNRVAEGEYPKPGRGAYDLAACVQAELRIRTRAESADIEQARLRKTMAEAQLAEIELGKQRAKFLDFHQVDYLVRGAFTVVRTTLVNFPNKLASRLSDPALAREVFKIADAEVGDILDQLSTTQVPGADAAKGDAA